MEFYYKIIKEKGLFIQKYKGEFSIEEYKANALKIIRSSEYKHVNKSLADYREAYFKGTVEIIDELIRFRNEINIQKILTVYIVSEPFTTVLAHLYIDKLQKKEYHYCSTMYKALYLLNIDMYVREMETIIKNLKKI